MLKVECIPNNDKKSTLSILVDGEPWRLIHTSIFGYHHPLPLCKECPDLDHLIQTFNTLEYQQAKQYALKRLSQMSMPSTTLSKSLQQKLVSKPTITRIIHDLNAAGYLNDNEWIASFIRLQKGKKMGPKAIAQKLAAKGLPTDQLTDQLNESLADEQSRDEQIHSIQQLLKTRYRSRNLSKFDEKRKVIGSLARRGFDLDIILKSVQMSVDDMDNRG